MTTRIKTDVLIIGAGSGGLSVAAGAVQMGADVTLEKIESHRVQLVQRGEFPVRVPPFRRHRAEMGHFIRVYRSFSVFWHRAHGANSSGQSCSWQKKCDAGHRQMPVPLASCGIKPLIMRRYKFFPARIPAFSWLAL